MADPTKEYEGLSFEELEKADRELAEQKSEIRERQVVVSRLLDAHRALKQLNLAPETIKYMQRVSTIGYGSTTAAEKKN